MNTILACTFIAIAAAAVLAEILPVIYTGSVTVKLGLAAVALAAVAQADKYL
jgi:hypothetical protein